MNTSTAVLLVAVLLLGCLLGAVLATFLTRASGRTRSVALEVECDLLRRRLQDAEAAAGRDRELAAVLAPLASGLGRVEDQVRVLERDRVDQYARLDAQLTAVKVSGEALGAQTAALVGALRSPNARGSWGEVQLRRVVEHAGMLARVDFTPQASATSPEGTTVRPDLVVHLPGDKNVVVDAKAPLSAFLEASELTGEPVRQRERLSAHAKALRGHVDALAGKEYWAAFAPAPELVICFIPGEAFLAAACEADPALMEHAMARRVVLATPTTLLALLRTVAMTWQQDALAGSARELFDLGRELYARLSTMGGHVGKLGRTLHRAVEDYNAMLGTLERRVLVTARKMRDLDVTDLDLDASDPVEAAARPLTAPELLQQPPELVQPAGSPTSRRKAS